MEDDLSRRVIGQKDAIRAVAQRLRLNKGPLKETTTSRTACFSSSARRASARPSWRRPSPSSCSAMKRRWSALTCRSISDGTIGIEKLIGMPRGIVGSERGGVLTEQLRENPYTVLLTR